MRKAAGTEPKTKTEPKSATWDHTTFLRTTTVVAPALIQARILSTMMPSTGPRIRDKIGPEIRPTPMPETRCIHEPTAMAAKIASAIIMPGISPARLVPQVQGKIQRYRRRIRSEEHTSELQSRGHLVC